MTNTLMVARINIPLLIVFCLSVWGCQQTVSSFAELNAIVCEPGSGYIIKRSFGEEVQFKVKYLPPELMALNDISKFQLQKTAYDSLLASYQPFVSFVMTIELDPESVSPDVMMLDVNSKQDYIERFMDMNFAMEGLLVLKVDNVEYAPVYAHLENIYGLKKSRDVLITFPNEARESFKGAANMDLVFYDEIFETGIYHFLYKKTELKGLPKVNIAI